MDAMTREVNKVIEKLIWQGDKTDGTGNMAVMDGFLVQLGADDDVVDVPIAGGTTAYDGLIAVYAAMTEEQKQAYLKTKAEHERLMKTDPEYRAKVEKRHQAFLKRGKPLMNDCIMSEDEF